MGGGGGKRVEGGGRGREKGKGENGVEAGKKGKDAKAGREEGRRKERKCVGVIKRKERGEEEGTK